MEMTRSGNARKAVLILSLAALAVAALLLLSMSNIFSVGITRAKPTLSEGEPVGLEHVEWIVNELVTDKIRTQHFKGKRMQVEFLVKPDNSYFTTTVELYVATTTSGRAKDPDVRLVVERDVVAQLLSAPDFFAEVIKLDSEGKIGVETLRSAEELEAMGYTGIYEELTGKGN
jgi:hypothetical protein